MQRYLRNTHPPPNPPAPGRWHTAILTVSFCLLNTGMATVVIKTRPWSSASWRKTEKADIGHLADAPVQRPPGGQYIFSSRTLLRKSPPRDPLAGSEHGGFLPDLQANSLRLQLEIRPLPVTPADTSALAAIFGLRGTSFGFQ